MRIFNYVMFVPRQKAVWGRNNFVWERRGAEREQTDSQAIHARRCQQQQR